MNPNQSGDHRSFLSKLLNPAAPEEVPSCSLGFPEIVRRAIVPRRAVWRSRLLSSRPLLERADPAARIIQILNDLVDPETALAKQLNRYLREQRELAGGGVWARYYESYDTMISFAEPYRLLLKFASDHLPEGDVSVLDVGAATLNFSLYLILRSAHRRMVAVDPSRSGMILGRRKIELAAGLDHLPRHRAFPCSILDPIFPVTRVHGAVVSNLLGNLPDRQAVYQKLHALVRGGGQIVLVEPTHRFRDPERMKRYMLELTLSAAANRSPVNEFDLALVAAVHLETFTTPVYSGPPLLTPKELEATVELAGLRVEDSRPFLSGMVRGIAVRRP